MPNGYVKKPPVPCHNCGVEIQRTRPSRSGHYFCAKEACRAAKQREYRAERKAATTSKAVDDKLEALENSAKILAAALHGPRQQCPLCGLLDAIPGYVHLTTTDEGCTGTGARGPVNGITFGHIRAIWPVGTAKYAPLAGSAA